MVWEVGGSFGLLIWVEVWTGLVVCVVFLFILLRSSWCSLNPCVTNLRSVKLRVGKGVLVVWKVRGSVGLLIGVEAWYGLVVCEVAYVGLIWT